MGGVAGQEVWGGAHLREAGAVGGETEYELKLQVPRACSLVLSDFLQNTNLKINLLKMSTQPPQNIKPQQALLSTGCCVAA